MSGFSGIVGPEISVDGHFWQQCGGISSYNDDVNTFLGLCGDAAYSHIVFACSADADETAEYVSPALSLSGVNLFDGSCKEWLNVGGTSAMLTSDFILSIKCS